MESNNNQKMREALKEIARITNNAKSDFDIFAGFERILKISNSALAYPARNCDIFSKAEVLEMLDDRSFSKEDTIEWLYTEAKGGADK